MGADLYAAYRRFSLAVSITYSNDDFSEFIRAGVTAFLFPDFGFGVRFIDFCEEPKMRMPPGLRSVMIIFLNTLATIATLGFWATSAVAQSGCVSGWVIDETGHPLEHIKVEAVKMGGSWTHHQAWTEANGKFQILNVPPAKYEIVSGEAEGPYPNHADSFFYGTPELYLSVKASSTCENVVVQLGPKAAKLNLLVLDAITKQPIERPMVELWRTNSGGGLSTVAPKGKINVPSLTELQLKLQAIGYEKSAPIKLPAFHPEEVRELTVELQPATKGCIAGSVVAEDNLPVTGAQVIPRIRNRGSFNEDHSVVTDSQGRFQINNLEVGPYHVHAAKISAGYLGSQNGIDLNLSVDSPCIEVALKIGLKAARLRLTAIDAKTQKEIAQIHTGYNNEERSTFSSSLVERLPGNVALVEPLRKLSVQIYADGYEENGKAVYFGPLAPDEQKDITVELQPVANSSVSSPH